MSYYVGAGYRYCIGLDKKGRPLYEETKVRQVTEKQIALENGKLVEYEPHCAATHHFRR